MYNKLWRLNDLETEKGKTTQTFKTTEQIKEVGRTKFARDHEETSLGRAEGVAGGQRSEFSAADSQGLGRVQKQGRGTMARLLNSGGPGSLYGNTEGKALSWGNWPKRSL